MYIPTTLYLSLRNSKNGLLTVGREVFYLIIQSLIILILGIMSVLSNKEDICSSSSSSIISPFSSDIEYHSKIMNNDLKCKEIIALSVFSFIQLIIVLLWLSLLFISIYKYRGYRKSNQKDAFDLIIHQFIKKNKNQVNFEHDSNEIDIEYNEFNSTPIENLNKNDSPISNYSDNINEIKYNSTLSNEFENNQNQIQNQNQNQKTNSSWRIPSLPIPEFKFNFQENFRNSTKSQNSTNTITPYEDKSFSNSKKPSNTLNNSINILPTLESTRNSIKSWKRGKEDLEDFKKDSKRIESWRISPIPLPDLNLISSLGLSFNNDNKSFKKENDDDDNRNSIKSQLSGLTLNEVRNSIQSIKSSSKQRDSIKSQFSYENSHSHSNNIRKKKESLEPIIPLPNTKLNGYRSTFQFKPELSLLENDNRNSMETLNNNNNNRDPRKIESWRISPIPLPNIQMSFENEQSTPSIPLPKKAIIHETKNKNWNLNLNDFQQEEEGGRDLLQLPYKSRKLEGIRNSAQSGFSLEHSRSSIRSQIGEIINNNNNYQEQEREREQDDNLSNFTDNDKLSYNSESRSYLGGARNTFGRDSTHHQHHHQHDENDYSWQDSYSSLGVIGVGQVGNFRKSTFQVNFDGTNSEENGKNDGIAVESESKFSIGNQSDEEEDKAN
ncbi:uncharacterized protein I206_107130 [Kwoniella pini CBS 10737]|uniref:Uncharacterized protein n=1 Tax=Kwoniella pini CBS 10737 TaxID=1296096 RepID=A0A1B9HZ31_9TREE|nr:uncharacterized protein I206_05326 [Kwoniella pini CBS 10737]OCF48547.1 hypothetical protein I206_05326 [Kwoniella pini CBS 10737]